MLLQKAKATTKMLFISWRDFVFESPSYARMTT